MLSRRPRPLALYILAALSISGCANGVSPGESASGTQSSPSQTESDSEGHDSGRYIDWETPFGADAPSFESVAEAQLEVPFEIVSSPASWGNPKLIQIVPPSSISDPADEQLAMVFDLADEGPILLEEKLAGEYSLDVLKQLAEAHSTDPAVSSDYPTPTQGPFLPAFQIIALRGTQGLLIQGNGIGRVMWVEDGVLFDIKGKTVSPDQVVNLAESL